MATKTKTTNGAETIETAFAAGSDAMKQSMDRAMKGFDEFATFNKKTMDALMQSANATTKGFEALTAEALSFQKQSLEEAMTASKAAMSSRSVQEFIEVNTDFAKNSFDAYVGQVTKFGDMFTKASKDAIEPINNRFSAFVELMQSSRA